jgi:cysteine-rich repeat protein
MEPRAKPQRLGRARPLPLCAAAPLREIPARPGPEDGPGRRVLILAAACAVLLLGCAVVVPGEQDHGTDLPPDVVRETDAGDADGADPGADADAPRDELGAGDADSPAEAEAEADGDTREDAEGASDADADGDADADADDGDAPLEEVGAEAADDGDAPLDELGAEEADVPPPVCGDGAVTGDEQCDDGSTTALDGCSSSCTWEYCGDGLIGSVDVVHDGFETGAPGRLPWRPGTSYGFDGTTERVHSGARAVAPANRGRNSTTASIAVRQATDGRVCFWYTGQSESCCDDFRFSVDGWSVFETRGDQLAWTQYCTDVVPGVHDFSWSYDKDGSISTGWDAFFVDDVTFTRAIDEQCDDGNAVAGDGCSDGCGIEECGNSVIDAGEECDDGNVAPLDGCSGTCRWEYCGDGVVGALSVASDGFESGDLTRLDWSPAAPHSFAPTTERARAGRYAAGSTNGGLHGTTATTTLHQPTDGRVCFWYAGQSESCCDHLRFAVDGGSPLLEAQGDVSEWTQFCADVAPGAHDFAWSYVKDSSVNTGWDAFFVDDVVVTRAATEACDDGNTSPGDGCSGTCTIEECGNATVDHGEECDDGNTTPLDGCSAGCAVEYCGDGVVGTIFFLGDDFETGDLGRLPWSPGAPWGFDVTGDHVHRGARALGSANGGRHGTTASIGLHAETDGRICFWYAGESEGCCDHFRFLVDGAVQLEAQGDRTAWTEFCTDVAAGAHDLAWEYTKDGSINTGWDAFYFDDLNLVRSYVEQCDDGNARAGDGCSPTCRDE